MCPIFLHSVRLPFAIIEQLRRSESFSDRIDLRVDDQARNCSSESVAGWLGYAICQFSHGFQRLLQSFAPTTHAKPSRLSVGNGPLGMWVGLYAESRSR